MGLEALIAARLYVRRMASVRRLSSSSVSVGAALSHHVARQVLQECDLIFARLPLTYGQSQALIVCAESRDIEIICPPINSTSG